MRETMLLAFAALGAAGAALGTTPSSDGPTAAEPAAAEPPKICKIVASDQRNTKPYELCLSKAEWDAKAIADAKDPNRMVCHYEEEPGTRLRSRKICVTAAEWDARRQANREVTERIQMQTCVPGAGC